MGDARAESASWKGRDEDDVNTKKRQRRLVAMGKEGGTCTTVRI